jgi:hypothetical protein
MNDLQQSTNMQEGVVSSSFAQRKVRINQSLSGEAQIYG